MKMSTGERGERSQKARDILAEAPSLTPEQVNERLNEMGLMSLSNPVIYTLRRKLQEEEPAMSRPAASPAIRQPEAAKQPDNGKTTTPTPSPEEQPKSVRIDHLEEVKALAKKVGGYDSLVELAILLNKD